MPSGKVNVVVCLICVALVVCDDSRCDYAQGSCQNFNNRCSGFYVPNMCGGPIARQCCVAGTDAPCRHVVGYCIYTGDGCPDGFLDNYCGGPETVKCCFRLL